MPKKGKRKIIRVDTSAKKVSKATKKYVKDAVLSSAELKHKQTIAAGVNVNTTFSATPITLISQGDGSSERTGLTVKPSSIQGNIRITRDTAATASSLMRYRMFLVQWHMNSADDAPDALADFLYEVGTNPMQSQFHVKKGLRDKFTVLWHYEGQIGVRGTTTTGLPCSRMHRINVRSKMRPIGYNSGATSAIGNIYLVMAGEFAAGDDDGVADYDLLVRYRDKA